MSLREERVAEITLLFNRGNKRKDSPQRKREEEVRREHRELGDLTGE